MERRNGWMETSLMSGRNFASLADFNAKLAEWLERAKGRWCTRLKPARSI